MSYRLIVIGKFKKLLLGKSFNGKFFIINRNKYSEHFQKGNDYTFYAKKKKKFKIPYFVPISDEEAGVQTVIRNI